VYLEGATTRRSPLSREHHGPRAVLNALERLADGYGSQIATIRQELAIAEAQLRDYQARLGAAFPHESYLSDLTGLRDQLKAGLSGSAPATAAEPPPSVPELAGRIKALKATHTIEATPERARKRRTEAEEPVTARIRRKAEAIPAAPESANAAPPPATSLPRQSPQEPRPPRLLLPKAPYQDRSTSDGFSRS